VTVSVLGSGAVVNLERNHTVDLSDQIMKVIDLADALDARLVCVFTEHDFSHSQHYVLPAERVTDALYETLGAAFNTVGAYAHEKNVLIGIENHGGSSATGVRLKRLLDMIPYKEVGVTFDPANFAYGGEDPYQALLAIQDRVVYTHWKDSLVHMNSLNIALLGKAISTGHPSFAPCSKVLRASGRLNTNVRLTAHSRH